MIYTNIIVRDKVNRIKELFCDSQLFFHLLRQYTLLIRCQGLRVLFIGKIMALISYHSLHSVII